MLALTLAEARIVARLLTVQYNKEHLFYVRDNYCITDIFGGTIDAYGPVVKPPVQLYSFIESGQFDGGVHTHHTDFTFSNHDVAGFIYKPFQFAEVVTPTQIFRLEKPQNWYSRVPYFLFGVIVDWGDIDKLNNDSDYRDQAVRRIAREMGIIYHRIE